MSSRHKEADQACVGVFFKGLNMNKWVTECSVDFMDECGFDLHFIDKFLHPLQ